VTDPQLLDRFTRTGDPAAMAEIVSRYGAMVLGVARRVTGCAHDAEDVAQACFVELARTAGRVNVSLPGYLHRLATRRAIDFVRQRKARQMTEAAAPRPDAPANRAAIVQHFLLGRSQREIAGDLKIDQSTFARRLAKALEVISPRDYLAAVAGANPRPVTSVWR
jgi:DNA-directed RNA polymerase specialized sigma24 family protein